MKYIDAGKEPEPFDATITLVTDDRSIIQTWKYSDCEATNYALFFFENLLYYKFKQSYGSETRDKTYFECGGLGFSSGNENILEDSLNLKTPTDDQRAQTFVVRVKGTEISPERTSYEFTKFAQITNEDLRILLPNSPFGETPKFYLESLPSKDKQWLYNLASMYINPGKIPEPFEVSIDVVSGLGQNLQTWEYDECKIIDYKIYIADSLANRMFTEKFQPELRDRTIFECAGISLSLAESITEVKRTRAIDFIPNDSDRAVAFTVEISGGDFQRPFTIYSFDNLEFTEKERGLLTPSSHQRLEYGLEIGSLPSKDKEEFYNLVSSYYNVGKAPEPFDVKVDILTGDGTILQTWDYAKCDITNYELFLLDNLLFYKGHGGRGSEIRDQTIFDCVGFRVDFTNRNSTNIQNFIPNYEDRAIMHVLHMSGGELKNTRSNELIQKFTSMGNQEFILESMPNKQHKAGYDFISKYINPGKSPELFDVRVDAITGDGTILYSISYSRCEITNYSVFVNENMALIKFLPQMRSEIREQGILDCSGVNSIVLPDKLPNSRVYIPPAIQNEIGIPAQEIICRDGFELMIRHPAGTSVCVKYDSIEKLEDRGWSKVTEEDSLDYKIRPIVPTDEERAISFVAHFQGPEIAPPVTSKTFSKFSPITNDDSLILSPDHPLDSSNKQFYLESLPSKDKQWLYNLASMYINPGKVPELFEVSIDVVSGGEEILQTWEYDECEIKNYDMYLDDSLLNYKFHDMWQSEIRDRTIFECAGLKLNYS